MAVDLNVRPEGEGGCPKCGAASVVQTSERIHEVLGFPVGRSIYRSSTCGACRWWWGERIKRPDHPRTPGVRSLIVLSWLLVVGACLALIPYKLQHDRIEAGYAAAPVAGDIWEVDLAGWPNKDHGHTRARVDTVTAHDVAISMCGYSYDSATDADKCDAFPHAIGGIPRAEVERLYDADTIEGIERSGDLVRWLSYLGIWLVAVSALFVVHARRSRRVLG